LQIVRDLTVDRNEGATNVILSAAASPILTRTSARRRPKDLESALGLRWPKRYRTRALRVRMMKGGAAAAADPSVAAKPWG
jgi:hypothetical protein